MNKNTNRASIAMTMIYLVRSCLMPFFKDNYEIPLKTVIRLFLNDLEIHLTSIPPANDSLLVKSFQKN